MDLDEIHLQYTQEIIESINFCQPEGNKIITQIPTKNGIHLITSPFNVDKFNNQLINQMIPIPDLQKKNPTLLYYPNSLL